MKLKFLPSREQLTNFLKGFGRFRPRVDHNSLLTISALLLILFIAFTIRMFPARWEIQKGSAHLSEFDPYFQYRFTEHLVKNGFLSWIWPTHWVDTQRWYPAGIDVAKTGYPGLPFTAATMYSLISTFGINIELMEFCAFIPPLMGMLACLAIYFLGKDMGGRGVGLISALLLALSPSYIQRSSFGFFDDETIGILALIIFSLLFLRSIERDRSIGSTVMYAIGSGLTLGYFCAGWGAAFYPIGVVSLFVFLLILLRRYTQKILLSYSLTFGLGLFISINVPRLGLGYLTQTAILVVTGVFCLLCMIELFRHMKSTRGKMTFVIAFLAALIGISIILWQLGFLGGIAGKFISVINPIAVRAPLRESVAEHRITAWGSFYNEFGISIIFFIASFYFILRDLNNRNLFLLIFGITSLYFSCSMVRLLVLLAPAFSLVAAVGIAGVIKPFRTLLKSPPRIGVKKKHVLDQVGREYSGAAVLLIFLVLMTNFAFPTPKVYRQAWAPVTITAGSLPILPNEPVDEWLNMVEWVNTNLDKDTVVCSWWDYGYWLTILGNVTTLADNGTVNRTQIENVGFTFMANETQSLKMLKKYDAQYILVFTTLALGQAQQGQYFAQWIGYGDEGKWMWMARISGASKQRFIENGFIDEEYAWTNETAFGEYNSTNQQWDWNRLGMNSTIYKLMSLGKHRWTSINQVLNPDQDAWSRNGLTLTDIEPKYFKDVYIAGLESEGYGGIIPLVCLYEIDWQKYNSDYPS
jgi:dolichyl-diphosphooligosaccharide--protein glycosyltransferase